jgi:flagellar motor switch protein FliG
MTAPRQEVHPPLTDGSSPSAKQRTVQVDVCNTAISPDVSCRTAQTTYRKQVTSVRKAAIVLVSLEQSLASQLLSHLDRTAVEAVTWEIARLEQVGPAERADVLDEFYALGLRRHCFVFDDVVKLSDADIRAAFHDEDVETWGLALAGVAAPVRDRILGAIATLPADLLRRHLDQLGPFRLSDSEAAQLEIAEQFRRLYDRGRVSLPESNGRDEVIV